MHFLYVHNIIYFIVINMSFECYNMHAFKLYTSYIACSEKVCTIKSQTLNIVSEADPPRSVTSYVRRVGMTSQSAWCVWFRDYPKYL